jgi:pyruvate/2-oxoglutarate dehydrogenase complex dihydrolipoamide dehydrogenase (E3) component
MAGRIAASGKTVALIERKLIGGTCVNDGCTPTKTLVASAYAAHLARRAVDFGVSAGPVGVDFAAVMARKDKVVGGSRSNLTGWLRGLANCTLVEGHARFLSPTGPGSATRCSKPSASTSTSAAGPSCPISRVSIR